MNIRVEDGWVGGGGRGYGYYCCYLRSVLVLGIRINRILKYSMALNYIAFIVLLPTVCYLLPPRWWVKATWQVVVAGVGRGERRTLLLLLLGTTLYGWRKLEGFNAVPLYLRRCVLCVSWYDMMAIA
jgi:hypothetical protein